ncbi:MAG: hypothetical protein JHC41_03115 [Nitrosopumilus sp.]|jgi:hypothetical protein|nr:hypothetical protein [Nitrosopumilus sp.]
MDGFLHVLANFFKLGITFILFIWMNLMDNAKVALIGGFCIVTALSVMLVFLR